MCRRNAQMLFLVKFHAFTLSFNFSFLFVDVCWLDNKVKVLFDRFSYQLKNTALDGMDQLEFGPVNYVKWL